MLYLRVRVPPDVASVAAGRKVALPLAGESRVVSVGKSLVKLSLATRDPAEARARFAAALAALLAFWEKLRRGPQPLNHKQRVALAGEVRQRVVAMFDTDPGDPEQWRIVQRINAFIGSEDAVGVLPGRQAGEAATPAEMAEYRYGKALDGVLVERAIVLDPADRAPLVEAVAKAMQEAAEVNLRKAQGDYSPDPGAARYPAFTVPQPEAPAQTHSGWTFKRAVDEQVKLRDRGKDANPLRPNTIGKYYRVADLIAVHRGSDDIATLTTREVDAWVATMQEGGALSNKTICDRLTSLMAIVNYARKLSYGAVLPDNNPVTLAQKPQSAPKPQGFHTHTLAEARAILEASRKETRPERRWVSWIMAYSGARVNEVSPLLASDFQQIEGRWFYAIYASGKRTVKNRSSIRMVPVHPDLITEGLLDFLSGKPDAPLFPPDTAGKTERWVKEALGVTREGFKPNHGWRHLFEDMCIGSGMTDKAVDYITGRASGSSADGYGRSEARLPGLAREMDKFPGYGVG